MMESKKSYPFTFFPFLCFRNNHRCNSGEFSFAGGIHCVLNWLHQDTEIQNLHGIMIIIIGFILAGFWHSHREREAMDPVPFFN